MFEIYLQWDQRISPLFYLTRQPPDLRLVEQKFSFPCRLVVGDVALFIGADVQVQHEDFVAAYPPETVLQVRPAGPQRFNFGSLKLHPGFVGLFDEIIVKGFFVRSDGFQSYPLYKYNTAAVRLDRNDALDYAIGIECSANPYAEGVIS